MTNLDQEKLITMILSVNLSYDLLYHSSSFTQYDRTTVFIIKFVYLVDSGLPSVASITTTLAATSGQA